MGIYTRGEITFSTPNLRGWFYRLCSRATSTVLNICLGWCGAKSLLVSGFYSSGDLLTILSASEDSRSLMGGSDVVHCVRVLLTGTTVAEFWACGSLGVCVSLCVGVCGHWGALYYCYVMDPRLGNVAKGICLILWLIM